MKYEDFAEEYQTYENSNMSTTLNAVVMEVHDSSLSVMEIKGGQPSNGLYFVSFANDENFPIAIEFSVDNGKTEITKIEK